MTFYGRRSFLSWRMLVCRLLRRIPEPIHEGHGSLADEHACLSAAASRSLFSTFGSSPAGTTRARRLRCAGSPPLSLIFLHILRHWVAPPRRVSQGRCLAILDTEAHLFLHSTPLRNFCDDALGQGDGRLQDLPSSVGTVWPARVRACWLEFAFLPHMRSTCLHPAHVGPWPRR